MQWRYVFKPIVVILFANDHWHAIVNVRQQIVWLGRQSGERLDA